MTIFANPAALWALMLVIALAIASLVSRWRRSRSERAWGGRALMRSIGVFPAPEWDLLRRACLWGALLLCLAAFARPQWGELAVTEQKVGLDAVIALDTSRSMAVTDAPPSRMERARQEVQSFLASVSGDRVALVDFAGVPVTLSPLTEDVSAIGVLLEASDPDLVPAQGTDIGKALEEAVHLFPQPHERDQVILLFSDGEDQGKEALAAARVAARLGIHIFCIGVGTEAGGTVPGPDGRPLRDPVSGAEAHSRLNASLLSQVAGIGDGRYWELAGAGSVVPRIQEELGRLSRREYASRLQAMRQDQFAWFLIPAIFLLLFVLVVPDRVRPEKPSNSAGKPLGAASLLAAGLFLVWPSAPCEAQTARTLADTALRSYANGQVEQALALYRRAIQSTASPALRPALHYDAGTCLLALKKPQEAQDELVAALSGAESALKRRALYNLAQAFQEAGDRDRALSTLRTLLVDDPSNREGALLYEWILRQTPPKQPPKPPQNPPPQPPPPDVLEQLPMPSPKALKDQIPPTPPPAPGMKPW